MPNPYEHSTWQAIERWERSGPSMSTRLGRLAAKPAEWATDLLVPKQLQEVAGEALYQLLSATNQAVHKTIPPERVVRQIRELGHPIDSHRELRGRDLTLSDTFARQQMQQHLTAATISGAATGLGGILLLAADIPALFATNLRMVQSIAVGYGYDLEDEAERHFALHLFRAAAGDPRTKIGLMQELMVVRSALARSALNEIARSSVMAASLVSLRKLAQKVGIEVVERKLVGFVPVLGAGIGAGFNFLFTREVARASVMGYRKRWLMEKYPAEYGAMLIEGG